MPLHMLKLCVGAESLEDLQAWSRDRLVRMKLAGEVPQHYHITRMVPKRADEMLEGGSLYWVIKGRIQARQAFADIVPFVDAEGVRRCKLVLENDVIATQWQPRRAFQGWRYLKPEDAPLDMGSAEASIPPELRAELAELGLL